jgi:hypothetical protein
VYDTLDASISDFKIFGHSISTKFPEEIRLPDYEKIPLPPPEQHGMQTRSKTKVLAQPPQAPASQAQVKLSAAGLPFTAAAKEAASKSLPPLGPISKGYKDLCALDETINALVSKYFAEGKKTETKISIEAKVVEKIREIFSKQNKGKEMSRRPTSLAAILSHLLNQPK